MATLDALRSSSESTSRAPRARRLQEAGRARMKLEDIPAKSLAEPGVAEPPKVQMAPETVGVPTREVIAGEIADLPAARAVRAVGREKKERKGVKARKERAKERRATPKDRPRR